MYTCIEYFELPFVGQVNFKNQTMVKIDENSKWKLTSEENKNFKLIKVESPDEWIDIPEWQLSKYFKKD